MQLATPVTLALFLAALPSTPVAAQSRRPEAVPTPSGWLQLRSGTSNTGFVPGSLEVSWRYKAQHPVRGLSVADGVVLIGTESADADHKDFGPDQRGSITALEASTGSELWTKALPSWVHSDPAIYRGVGFVTFGRTTEASGGIIALDPHSGRVIWSFLTEGGFMPAPAIDTANQTVVAAGWDGILYALSLSNGAVEHRIGLRGLVAMSSPRIDDHGGLYVGASGELVSYATATGHVLWSFRTPEFHELGDIPVAVTDTVVFTTGTHHVSIWKAFRELPVGRFITLARNAFHDPENTLSTSSTWFQAQWLLAIDRRDGHLLWQRPLGVSLTIPRNKSGTPVVADQQVIISSPVSGTLWAFDVATGREIWRRRLDSPHKGAVTVFGTDVLFGDKSGHITWLRRNDGALIGRCDAGAPFTEFAPLIVGRTLFAATHDGWVHAAPYDQVRRRASVEGASPCF